MCIRDRDNGIIRKLAAYVILGIHTEGKKEVLTITIGDKESAKYWLSVLNELKNRGVKDILIICADGLTGIKDCLLYTSYQYAHLFPSKQIEMAEKLDDLGKGDFENVS